MNSAAYADLAEDATAEVEMGQRDRLRDLEVNVMIVCEDGIVGPHEPPGHELVRVHVQEQRAPAGKRHCDLADHPAQLTSRARFGSTLEEVRG